MDRNPQRGSDSHADLDPGFYRDSPAGEQVMRAQFALVTRLHLVGFLAGDSSLDDHIGFAAAAIQARWRAHESLARTWVYLGDAYVDVEARPHSMRRFVTQMSEFVDAGLEVMTPQDLRSHHQALSLFERLAQERERRQPLLSTHELTAALSAPGPRATQVGGGTQTAPDRSFATAAESPRRPDPAEGTATSWAPGTLGSSTVEPYDTDPADPCNPRHYPAAVASWAERVMRADLARYTELWHQAAHVDTPTDYDGLVARAQRIAQRYTDRHDITGATWSRTRAAVEDWRRAPATMARLLDSITHDIAETGATPYSALDLRNLLHARELTGHRTWTTTPTPTGPGAEQITAALATGPDSGTDMPLTPPQLPYSPGAEGERTAEEGPDP